MDEASNTIPSQEQQSVSQPSQTPITPAHTPLDNNSILTILMLIYFYPLGVILMFLYMKHWPRWMKLVIILPVILAIGAVLLAGLLVAINPVGQLEKAREVQEQNNLTLTPTPTESVEQTVCPMDAMQCPDGSWVGRVGPNCEFQTCPATGSARPTQPTNNFNSQPIEPPETRPLQAQ